jgi:hypothetical protein
VFYKWIGYSPTGRTAIKTMWPYKLSGCGAWVKSNKKMRRMQEHLPTASSTRKSLITAESRRALFVLPL